MGALLVMAVALFSFSNSYAACAGCNAADTGAASAKIQEQHTTARTVIAVEFQNNLIPSITQAFEEHKTWLVDDFFNEHVYPALLAMTDQISATALHQTLIIGTFFDAKQQLETQRTLQVLQAEAHKDYHPSDDFCWFGTNVRSLAESDSRSQHNSISLSRIAQQRHLGTENTNAASSRDEDYEGRWRQFTSTYCDPKDNNWQGAGSGLELACGAGGLTDRKNRDIDFTRLIEEPRTLDVNFTNGSLPENGDEEDILALAKNLYGHKVLTREIDSDKLKSESAQNLYLALRSVAAKRSVAENSFNSIVGLKSSGSEGVAEFLAAIMVELGIPEGEVYDLIGNQPSYYAQLEVLAKKIYQNPNFFANLYDKPANVERKKVALKAIELMLDRAIYESQVRQEMVMSVLLSSKLRSQFRAINAQLEGLQ